jgi:hypothetical protein
MNNTLLIPGLLNPTSPGNTAQTSPLEVSKNGQLKLFCQLPQAAYLGPG